MSNVDQNFIQLIGSKHKYSNSVIDNGPFISESFERELISNFGLELCQNRLCERLIEYICIVIWLLIHATKPTSSAMP